MKKRLSANIIRKHLLYSPKTGDFYWKIVFNKRPRGIPAGWAGTGGYRHIKLFWCSYAAHRLAWVIMTGRWPRHQIDHKNMNPSDNRWSNLRAATNRQNKQNSAARSDNKIGLKGVCWKKKSKKWVAQISAKGKVKHLGLFATAKAAHAAYRKAARKHFGEYARF